MNSLKEISSFNLPPILRSVLVIYILTFMVWLKDESDSLDKTMQALDDYLGKVDQILNFI